MVGGVGIRSTELTLEKKINIPGDVYSAHVIAGGKLITKVCDDDNNKYCTYIGTETDPQQSLLHDVKYEGYTQLSQMSATDNRIAVIDSVNKQLRVYSAAGDYQFNISLTDMKRPCGVHLLPDDSAVLVTDVEGGELRKYLLTAAAKPVWRCRGLGKPTGVTTDESGLIMSVAGVGGRFILYQIMVCTQTAHPLSDNNYNFIFKNANLYRITSLMNILN